MRTVHINEFEPFIQAWKNRQGEDVSFSRLPVGFGRPTWNMLAQGYVMAEVLGVANAALNARCVWWIV